LARRCNEFAAELVRARPDRFASFACIPLPDVDASLEELSYAKDVLGLDGFVLFTNSNGVYLGDAVLDPVFEEFLAARFAIIDEMGYIAGAEQRGTAADMFRRMYWDTAISASVPVLRMLRDIAGTNQVLYGTDFPYQRRDLAARSKHVLQGAALNDLECGAILGGNASRLFPRLRSALAES
jgi:predicted TIM-barrel fold metal-dependent hydrolase